MGTATLSFACLAALGAVDGLVVAPHRALVYTPAYRKQLQWRSAPARPRRPYATVARRQPSMLFGVNKLFNWLSPTDIMFTLVLAGFLYRRLRQVQSDPTAGLEDDDDDDGAVNRGNKLFKQLSGANYHFVAQSEEDIAALRTMHCKKCGFTIFVAKNRMKRHFAANGLQCMNCGAVAPDFYNENDPDDPINFAGATLDMIGDESEKGAKAAADAAAAAAAGDDAGEAAGEEGVAEVVAEEVVAEAAGEPGPVFKAVVAQEEEAADRVAAEPAVVAEPPAVVAEPPAVVAEAPAVVAEAPAPAPAPAPKPASKKAEDDIFAELGI
jgi:hypothetical protein